MPTKYIYEDYPEYVWCKKAAGFPSDCEDDESTWIWANWADWLPGFPYIDRDPCMVPPLPCFPWEVDDIIYDAEGKWKVLSMGTWSWQLGQYNMYDCYWRELQQNYYKFFHLDYVWNMWALLDFVSAPAKSAMPSIIQGLSLLGLIDRTPALVEGLGINLGQKEED